MKIVVIGGTGLIGSKVVEKLKHKGHEAIAAAPNTGVNTASSRTRPLHTQSSVLPLEGAIRSKVNDEPERTYKAGESWTEKPGDHHQVSHNASNTEPAKLLD